MKMLQSINKTTLSVASALLLGLVLAGCTAPPAPSPLAQAPEPAATESSNIAATASQDETVESEATHESSNGIVWLTSYDKALAKAKESNKPVMIDFYADWCTACHYLDKNIYTASGVIQESKKFVNLKIDTDKQTDIAAQYKVYALPTIIFLNGDGKVLWRLEGAPSESPYFVQTMQKAHNKFIEEA